MKRKKKIILALNLLLGGFAVSTLAGCGEEGISSVYTLDLQFNSELGSVTSETPKGVAGDTVTVKITPNEGIVVDSIKVNGETAEADKNGVLTFTAVGGKNTVEVNFKDPSAQPSLDTSFSVKAEYDNTRGTVTLDKTAGTDYADPTSVVKVTIKANEGYFVDSITVNGESKDVNTTEFVFQPKQGENIVQVTFGEEEGPVDEKKEYSFDVSFNEEGGTVVGDKTAGELTEGTKVKFTVAPKDNYEVKSVTFNGTALTISSDGIYEVTPVEGKNTFVVEFKAKEVEPPKQTYSIKVNVVNQDCGTYTLSKTEGNVGETVTLTVTPNSGYQVQVIFNDELIALNEDFSATLTPINGENSLVITFNEPASGLAMLEDGFDINFDESTLLGKPDFDKDYFYNFFVRIYEAFSPNDPNAEQTIGQIYDTFISQLNATKSTLEHLNTVIDETDCLNKIKELQVLSQQGISEDTFKQYVSLVADLKSKLTQDEFSYGCLLMMIMTTSSSFSGSYNDSFGLLYSSDFESAISYFEGKGDSKTAAEIKKYSDSVLQPNLLYPEIIKENEGVALLTSHFLYPMMDSLLAIESDTDKLASNIYNAVMLFNTFTSGMGMEEILKPENNAKNIETLQFIGKALYRAMPNIKSFKKLTEKSDIIKDFIGFINNIRSKSATVSVNVSFDSLFSSISEDSDSLYYVLKFIGKSLENITEDDYNALIELIKGMSSGSADNTQIYKSAIKISKLFVRTLFEFGDAQKLLTEKFATGFSLIGKIMAASNKMSIYLNNYSLDTSDSDAIESERTEQAYVTLFNGDNAFGNFDFTKVPEFIATVAQYQADKVGEAEINYIQSFFNDINAAMGSFFTNENAETFTVEYVSNPLVNGDLKIKVNGTTSENATQYTVSEADTSSRIKGTFNINFDGFGSATFSYSVGNLSYYNISGEIFNILGQTRRTMNELFIQNDYQFNDLDDGLYYDNYNSMDKEPKVLLRFKNNLDISTLGWNYKRIEIEGRVYFLKYYVYKEEDVFYEYRVENSTNIFQDSEIETSYIYYDKFINTGSHKTSIGSGTYQLEEPIILDTSKPGENTVSVTLKNGETVEVTYKVYEVVSSSNFLECYEYQPKFEYQSVYQDENNEYYFGLYKNITYIDDWGEEIENRFYVGGISLNRNEFENKLDNSEAGQHTDYATYKGERYEFTYYVNGLLDSSDKEYQYYIDDPYLLGDINGFLDPNDYGIISKARRLFFEDENKEYISFIEYDFETPDCYFDKQKNDLSNIEVGEAGTTSDVEVTIEDGTKLTAKLYFSNYTVEYEDARMEGLDNIILDNLPSDDYVISLYQDVTYWYNTWSVSDVGRGYGLNRGETTFGKIKSYLDLESPGVKESNIVVDGVTYTVAYTVCETLEMTPGDFREFNDKNSSTYGLYISGIENLDTVVLKSRDANIDVIGYSGNNDIYYKPYDSGEYVYYVFNTENISQLWLMVSGSLYSYIEVLDSSKVIQEIYSDPVYATSYKTEDNLYSVDISYFESMTIDGAIATESKKYKQLLFTLDELKELCAQSEGKEYIAIEVEIHGQPYSVNVPVEHLAELIEEPIA